MCILNVFNYMLLLLSRKKRCKKSSFFSSNWHSIHDGNIFSIYFFIKSTSAKIFSILNLFVVIYSNIIKKMIQGKTFWSALFDITGDDEYSIEEKINFFLDKKYCQCSCSNFLIHTISCRII